MTKNFFLIPACCALLIASFTACSSSQVTNKPMQMTQSQMDMDADITQKMNDFLSNDTMLSADARNVSVSTSNGIVSLEGNVATAQEKDRIMKKASSLSGVKKVNSQLTVGSSSSY